MYIDWGELGFWVAVSVAGGLGIFHVVAGYYHLRYYVLRKDEPETWKIQPKRFLPARLQRAAVLSSSGNLLAGGVLTGILIYAATHGLPTQLYFNVSDYGWLYTIGATILYFFLVEAAAFYVHWALHLKIFYKRFHRSHHRYVATTPYVTVAVHPVVFFSLQISTLLPIFVLPLHPASIAIVLIYALVFNIVDHSGVSLESRIPWQASSHYHDDHHIHFHVNFGQHLMLFDRLHGTLRRKKRSYGEDVYGGKGVPGSDTVAPTQADPDSDPSHDEYMAY